MNRKEMKHGIIFAAAVLLLALCMAAVPAAADTVTVPSDGMIDGYVFSIEPVADDFETVPCTVVFQVICSAGFSDFAFDFGDGSAPVTSYSSQLLHTYANGGTYYVSLTAAYDEEVTYVYQKQIKIVINSFKKDGEITISSDLSSQYLGENLTLSGKNTHSDYVYLYMKGTNFRFTPITNPILVNPDGSWEFTFDPNSGWWYVSGYSSYWKRLDAGTYTFYAEAVEASDAEPAYDTDDLDNRDLRTQRYAKTSVALKQPFVTLHSSPISVMEGASIHIVGNAPSTDTLCYYLIGRDTFKSGFIDVMEDNTFSADIPTTGLKGSQSLVIQHPMYDKIYNIYLGSDGCIYMIRDADDTPRVLFDTAKRTGFAAANALCDNLDSQDIDDMHAKASVEVYPESGIIISNCLDISSITDDSYEFAGYSSEGNVDLYLKFPDNSLMRLTESSAVPVSNIWHASVSVPCFDTVGTYVLYAVAGYAANTPVESELLTHMYDFLSADVYMIPDEYFPGEVVVQNSDDFTLKGSAKDTLLLQYYIFGTNYVKAGKLSVIDGRYYLSFPVLKGEMAAGQYFLVLQHPGNDKVFNIAPIPANEMPYDNYGGYNIVLNKAGAATAADMVLFNTNNRQSANAAQALCDALSYETIDDTYIKASFIVAGPTSYIDAIPSTVVKGQILTVSGTTTGHKGDVVSVELLSTAFAAIPKEAVGFASFVALSTKIGDDGVWSISFDTSTLNADDYICSVAVGQLEATTSKVTIVEGSGPMPTQPVRPQPTATPTTPMVGGDSGTIHIHTNVPGAKVSFYLIDITSGSQPVEVQYADANGNVYFKVYTTATPPKYAVVTAPGYIQDITSQVTLRVPAPGETLRYYIPLTPISPTPVPTGGSGGGGGGSYVVIPTVTPTPTPTPTVTPTPQPTPVPYISGPLPLPVQPVRGGA